MVDNKRDAGSIFGSIFMSITSSLTSAGIAICGICQRTGAYYLLTGSGLKRIGLVMRRTSKYGVVHEDCLA